jgi:pilus assembly protein CpaB
MAAKPKAVIIAGVLAVLVAAVAAYALYTYLKGQERKVSEAVATERTVVAAVEIPVGTTINMTQVKTAEWPKANMPQGAFAASDQVIGRTSIQTFMPGDAITETKLMPKEGPVGIMTYKIPEGHRAMTVAVDQVAGVAGFINPGNIVDVVLTASPPGANQQISKIVLQNVPVLAIGQIVEQKEGKPVIVPTVTVDITPEDSEKLAIASTQGKLQLVLRRLGDKEIAKTTGTTVSRVIGGVSGPPVKVASASGAKAAKVAKTPAAPVEQFTSIEIYRGSTKSTEKFKAQ